MLIHYVVCMVAIHTEYCSSITACVQCLTNRFVLLFFFVFVCVGLWLMGGWGAWALLTVMHVMATCMAVRVVRAGSRVCPVLVALTSACGFEKSVWLLLHLDLEGRGVCCALVPGILLLGVCRVLGGHDSTLLTQEPVIMPSYDLAHPCLCEQLVAT